MRFRLFLTGLVLLSAVCASGVGVSRVEVSGTEADAFRLSWPSVDCARGYAVNVWSNGVVGASDGVVVLSERFSSVPNQEYTKEWPVNDINLRGDYHFWTGALVRGYPSKSDGDLESAVVLGTENAPGWLLSEPLEVSGETVVRVRLTRHTDDDTAPALVAFVRDGVTNVSVAVSFSTAIHAFADYVITVSNLTRGCRLLVSSQRKLNGSKFGRVAVSEISVRSGCLAGEDVQVPVVSNEFVGACSYSCAGLAPALYGYSVAAQGELADPTPVTGEVDMRDPPWLRCWRASGFLPKPGTRALDLSGMDEIATARAWRNGLDGDGLYAFSGMGADVDVRPYSTAAVYLAVYQFNAGTEECRTNALALLGTGSGALWLVLPIRLDVKRPLEDLSVAYALWSLYRNGATADTELAFSWMKGDALSAMEDADADWVKEEDGGWKAGVDVERRVERRVKLPVRQLREANYLFLRWGVPQQAHSVMIGITELTVSGALRKPGLQVTVK